MTVVAGAQIAYVVYDQVIEPLLTTSGGEMVLEDSSGFGGFYNSYTVAVTSGTNVIITLPLIPPAAYETFFDA